MKKILFTMMLALFLGACTDRFEEVSINPYGISDKSLEQDYNNLGAYYPPLFTSFIGGQVEVNLCEDSWVDVLATPTPFSAGKNNTTYFLNFNGGAWNRLYDKIMAPTQQVIKIADKGGYTVFSAWAKLIRVFVAQELTARQGPIIYSNYGSPNAVIKYDSEKEVYNQLFAQLDSVVSVFSANPTYLGLKRFDASYKGDLKKWIKVANSFRLKLAIRISKVDPALAKAQGEKALSDPGGLVTSNSDNFNLSLYGQKIDLALICFDWDDTRMSAGMESFLIGLKDNRISSFFQPVLNKSLCLDHPDYPYKGIRNGAVLVAKDDRIPFSKIAESFKTAISRRYLTAADVLFNKAEASLRGWTGAGDAKTNYENGVKASFADWGATGVDAYLADGTSKPINYTDPISTPVNDFISRSTVTVKWEESDSKELKLEKIITQKWIDCFTHTMDSWNDFRRTGYPKLPNVYRNDSDPVWGVIPAGEFIKRVVFVNRERTGNPGGVADATIKLGGPDLISTRLWFDTGGPNF